VSVETLRAELSDMTEPQKAAELEALPEGDPRRPTPETLAERHDVPIETVYETVDEVIAATLPLRHSTFYVKWCLKRGLEPWPGWPARPGTKSPSLAEGPTQRSEEP
jgi:hypothetical protein